MGWNEFLLLIQCGASQPVHRSLGHTQVLAPTQLRSHILAVLPPSMHSSYAGCLLLLYKHQLLSNLKLRTPVLLRVGGPSCTFPLANPYSSLRPQLQCHLCREVFHDLQALSSPPILCSHRHCVFPSQSFSCLHLNNW